MRPITLKEFKEFPLGDAELVSIIWDGTDPNLWIELALYTHKRVRFRFDWVSGLSVHLDQEEKGQLYGYSWDVSAEQIGPTRNKVLFDFAGQGSITFEFAELGVEDLN